MGYQETLTGENAQRRNLDGVFFVNVPAVAQGATDLILVGVAKFTGKLKSVTFYPKTLITGADTNTRLHRLYNRKDDATGVAVMASLQYDSGIDAPAKIGKTITLSGTPANLVVEEGDVIEWNSSHVGTGLADGGGLLEVRLGRD